MWNVALHAAYWGFALFAINSKRRCVVRGFRAQARQPGPYPGGGGTGKACGGWASRDTFLADIWLFDPVSERANVQNVAL